MDDVTAALPYRLLDRPKVLVLGAGGGTDVLFAIYHGARAIDAVELNPQVTELLATLMPILPGTYTTMSVSMYTPTRPALLSPEVLPGTI